MNSPRFLPRLLAASLVLLGLPAAAPAQAPAPGDFRPLLRKAIQDGASQAVIPPGTYRFAPDGNVFVPIRGAHDLTIVADGVTLVCGKLTRAVGFERCRNVTLRGLTVDYDPLPFTQGTVTAVAGDLGSVDIRLHAGYPRRLSSRIDLCDPQTRYRKRGMPFLWGTAASWAGPDTVRISLPGIGQAARVGDLASLSTGPEPGCAPHAITLDDCSGMTLRDVTVFSAPGMGIIETDGEGGARYLRCRVVPGPRPAGADQDRLLSSSWDAMQTKTVRRGPVVEDCVIERAGDDSWSVQSSDFVVLAAGADGKDVIVGYRDPYCSGPLPGDRLLASADGPEAVVTARAPAEEADLSPEVREKLARAKPWDVWRLGRKYARLTLDRPAPFAVGQSVFCPDRQANGFVFRNNRLHSSGRILVKASDGLIEGNTVVDGHSAVTICPEVPDGAASSISNVVVRNNAFSGTGWFCPNPDSPQAGSLSVTAGKGQSIRNVTVEGNRFDDVHGPQVVILRASGVRVAGNTFTHPAMTPPNVTGRNCGVDPLALFWVGWSDDVVFSGNAVPGGQPVRVETGPDVTHLTVSP